MIEKARQDLETNRQIISKSEWTIEPKAHKAYMIYHEERDVISLRNPTEDKRAFRLMLTSADQKIQLCPQVFPVNGPLTYKKAAFLTSSVH